MKHAFKGALLSLSTGALALSAHALPIARPVQAIHDRIDDGLRFRCLDPSPDAVAGHDSEQIVGAFDDPAALRRLAAGVDVITSQ